MSGRRIPISQRFEYLEALEDGWFDGEGKRVSKEVLIRAKETLIPLETLPDTPQPYLYPTPQGFVSAEWSIGKWEVDMDISGDHEAEVSALHVETGEEDALLLQLGEPGVVDKLSEFLIRLRTK